MHDRRFSLDHEGDLVENGELHHKSFDKRGDMDECRDGARKQDHGTIYDSSLKEISGKKDQYTSSGFYFGFTTRSDAYDQEVHDSHERLRDVIRRFPVQREGVINPSTVPHLRGLPGITREDTKKSTKRRRTGQRWSREGMEGSQRPNHY